ncbi:hypothetical protein WR25_22557 isoform B [Diploscapter pachys]|uniref:G-protein coupled receptors family 1 profile domain-containing protein n=1 Tax=Diploscapter pachys TaxID=2018661 RepID=A0A2A2JY66_9BILA|nr:hypothetical protein WR25_22557 isoform B [Diploscapter pachys]
MFKFHEALIDPAEDPSQPIQWRNPLLAIVLISICLLTVAGNCLVVIAVCTKRYLRNPTGYLIISLAIADLIVGLVVMPLNSLFEMTNHVWLLGLPLCDLFHALDILASTASIWNLCVISLDRYMAGQDPIGYRDKVSKRRILMAIILVWVLSAFLSFPGIIWWRTSSPHLYIDENQCLFTDSAMYIAFSSLVSFYIPLILILFAYGKVFIIATRHSQGLRKGVKKMKQSGKKKRGGEFESMGPSSDCGSSEPTLRIHFGRSTNSRTPKMGGSMRSSRRNGAGNETTRLLLKQVSCRSLNANGAVTAATTRLATPTPCEETNGHCFIGTPNGGTAIEETEAGGADLTDSFRTTGSRLTVSSTEEAALLTPSGGRRLAPPSTQSRSPPSTRKKLNNVREKSRQMMKYVHEQRAARTLSIVVGAFILCWTPFFVFSPLTAFSNMVRAMIDFHR